MNKNGEGRARMANETEAENATMARQGALLAEYLTPSECASELGIKERTLLRWHQLQEGPPRTKVGRRTLYRRAAVAGWLRAHEDES